MRVYLSGPMRGKEGWNFSLFEAVATRWADRGHIVFNPAAVAKALGYGPPTRGGSDECTEEHLRHVILSDMLCIVHSEAVVLLPGWERSVGCTVEVAIAQFLGRALYDAQTMQPLEVAQKPWGVAADTEQMCTRQLEHLRRAPVTCNGRSFCALLNR